MRVFACERERESERDGEGGEREREAAEWQPARGSAFFFPQTRFDCSPFVLTDPLLIQHNTTNAAASSYGGSGCRWANSIIKTGGQRGDLIGQSAPGEWHRFAKWMGNGHCAAAGGGWLFTHNNGQTQQRRRAFLTHGSRTHASQIWPEKWPKLIISKETHAAFLSTSLLMHVTGTRVYFIHLYR